jgi:hypothetical protein
MLTRRFFGQERGKRLIYLRKVSMEVYVGRLVNLYYDHEIRYFSLETISRHDG